MVNFGHNNPVKYEITERTGQLPVFEYLTRRIPSYLSVIFITILAGCASDDGLSSGFYDPVEPANRAIHDFNKGVDKYSLRPISRAYAAVTPDPVENMIENAGDNLSAPADAINHFLQGNFKESVTMLGRFGANSTIGLLGLFDPATSFGWVEKETDFGETLGKWGVGEGAYLELPLLGPSSVRNAAGRIVDVFIDPVNIFAKSPEIDYIYGAKALDIVDARHRYGVLLDQVLYDSVDSYSATRNGYFQSTRNLLKGQTDEDDLEDPFAFE